MPKEDYELPTVPFDSPPPHAMSGRERSANQFKVPDTPARLSPLLFATCANKVLPTLPSDD
eukprot:5410292-Amphidinium_carterae.1